MKFAFVTCVKLGLSCMEVIHNSGHKLDLAITLLDEQAKNKSGRVYLDGFCLDNNVPLVKSSHVNNQDVLEAIKESDIDWLFIIGWSQIAGQEVLEAPNKGVIGMHPTLLPEGRGRAAIPWAIIKGLEKTGVTMFKMDGGVDTGSIIGQKQIPLYDQITATELYNLVDQCHVELIEEYMPLLSSGKIQLQEQDESQATNWPGRTPEQGQINLEGSVHTAETLIRAVTHPYPGAFYFENSTKIVVWRSKIVEQKGIGNSYLDFHDGTLELLEYESYELPEQLV